MSARTPSDPNPLITQRDLARQLGIGQVTVSRALAGDHRVTPAMRQRVLEAASRLGYRRNATARAMRTGRHGAVGLLLGSDPEHSAVPSTLLWGLQEELRSRGLRLSLSWLDEAEPALLAEWSVDGCLVFYTHDIPAGLPARLAAQMPATLWLNADLERDCVLPDDLAAARELGRRLHGLGHRRIGWVGRGPGFTHYARQERLDGLREAGLAVVTADRDAWAASAAPEAAAMAWLRETRPSAVVAHELDSLLPLHAAACRLGMRIPQDLSLAVFSTLDPAHWGIPVSTMRVPGRALAAAAVERLLARIAEPRTHLQPLRVPLEFHDQGTLAPPP